MKILKFKKVNKRDIKAQTLEQYLQKQYPSKKARATADERFRRLELGYEIYSARRKRKLTQVELAKKMQTTQSEVARIESGDQNLTYDKLVTIAKILSKEIRIRP